MELPSWSLLLRETITWPLLRCKLLLPNVQREAHGVSSVWSGYVTWEAAQRGGIDSKSEESEGLAEQGNMHTVSDSFLLRRQNS